MGDLEYDPAALSTSEDLDEDELRVDPLEEGIDPPEGWSAADRFGTTASERYAGEGVERKIRQERPDVEPADVPERPVAATAAEELDESIDELPADVESVAPEGLERAASRTAPEQGENADGPGRTS